MTQDNYPFIQYHGTPGITESCLDAIMRLIHFGHQIEEVRLLTCGDDHCFLLLVAVEGYIAIKSGFSSGYEGEGPRGLATALQIFQRHVSHIKEYDISSILFERVDHSCLSSSDIDEITSIKQVSPSRIQKYIYAYRNIFSDKETSDKWIHGYYPSEIPLKLIDSRIIDLAIKFKDNPDLSLLSAYRRLEDIVRKRTGLAGEVIGAKLFSKVFRGDNSLLYWEDIESAEREGRAALFEGTYMAFRNRRAHREMQKSLDNEIREFLLLNELFILESCSICKI